MGWDIEDTLPVVGQEPETFLFSDKQIEELAKAKPLSSSKICCLLYGKDGTGKSGIAFDYLTEEDIKAGYKLWIIDLDGGSIPLLTAYHSSKRDCITVIDPLELKHSKTGTEIDYLMTFAKVKAIVRYVRDHHIEQKIKGIVFDGLTTALDYAEQQMRLDKNIDVDGGVQLRYWLNRNKLFLETLEQIRCMPIAKFFIGHENFIMKAGQNSAVIEKTNAMMIQKIRCVRNDNLSDVKFNAIIDKSKYNISSEGANIEFGTVSKSSKEFNWNTDEIFKMLI